MASPSREYSDRTVQGICSRELTAAIGFIADEIEGNRTAALDYYFGKPRGDEQAGLSKVQSLDVADMVEAVLSFMVPSLTSQSLVQFVSVGADDEEQSAKESRIVQALTRSGQSNAYVAIQEAAKDALLLRNGILKCWIQVDSDVQRKQYQLPGDKQSPDSDALGQLMQREKADQEKVVTSAKREPKPTNGVYYWQVEIKTTKYKRTLRMAAVDPCNFYFCRDASSMDPNTLRFVAERQIVSRSELIDEGISQATVAALPKMGDDKRGDTRARRRYSSAESAEDFWQEQIEIYRCYPLLGTGEGGRAERWLVTMAGTDKLIAREKAHCVPYAVGAVLFAGHSFQGVSLFDKLRETQDTKTGLLRAWMNNAQLVNIPRAALRDGQVNEDDFYDVRVGGGIKTQAAGAIEWVTVPDIGPSCLGGLQYQDKMRSERGGASLDLMAPGLQLNSPTATGTEREIGVKEQLAALFAANLAQTMLRSAYLIAHKLLRYEAGPQVEAQSGGQWVKDEPGRWPARDDVAIVIGLSPAERARRLHALGEVIGQQEKALAAGLDGVITTKGQLYRAMTEWTRAAGLDAPERYWIDPDSPEAVKAAKEREAEQEQLGRAQAELLGRIKILESQVDTYRVQLQEAGKYYSEVIRADVEEMKVLGHSTAQLEAAKIGGTMRSGALTNAADATAQAAGQMAAQPMPQAGQLPPGGLQ